jgi:hypothetical protein
MASVQRSSIQTSKTKTTQHKIFQWYKQSSNLPQNLDMFLKVFNLHIPQSTRTIWIQQQTTTKSFIPKQVGVG